MELLTDCSEITRVFESFNIRDIEYIHLSNDTAGLTDELKRKIVTQALFKDKSGDKGNLTLEFIADNLYFKYERDSDNNDTSLFVQPIEGYAINLTREANIFRNLKPFCTQSYFVEAENVFAYTENEINYFGLMQNSDMGSFLCSGETLRGSGIKTPTIVVKFINKPKHIAEMLRYNYTDWFESDENYLCSDKIYYQRLFSSLDVGATAYQISYNLPINGGLILIGDFSELAPYHGIFDSVNGEVCILGELPHDSEVLVNMLMKGLTNISKLYINDKVAYNMIPDTTYEYYKLVYVGA